MTTNQSIQLSHSEHHSPPTWRTSAAATLHCLTGCAIGEVLGLMIGVTLQLGVTLTITLAVALAFIIGISLAVRPLMQDQNLKLIDALRVVWVAELISIGVMELAMNWVDFYIGGISAPSIFSSIFSNPIATWFTLEPCGLLGVDVGPTGFPRKTSSENSSE